MTGKFKLAMSACCIHVEQLGLLSKIYDNLYVLAVGNYTRHQFQINESRFIVGAPKLFSALNV